MKMSTANTHVLVDGITIILVIYVVMKWSLDCSNQPRSDVETEHMDRISPRIHRRMLCTCIRVIMIALVLLHAIRKYKYLNGTTNKCGRLLFAWKVFFLLRSCLIQIRAVCVCGVGHRRYESTP